MNLAEFVSLCYQLEKTPSRLAKIAAAEYLMRLETDEIRYGVTFFSGRPFPVSDPRSLEIGPAALSETYKIPEADSFSANPLTLKDVADSFAKIAEASGKGSWREKFARLRELVERVGPQERPISFRLLHHHEGVKSASGFL